MKKHEIIEKELRKLGSSKSGFYGHAGRKGKRGGSVAGRGVGGQERMDDTKRLTRKKKNELQKYTKDIQGSNFLVGDKISEQGQILLNRLNNEIRVSRQERLTIMKAIDSNSLSKEDAEVLASVVRRLA